MRSDLVAFKSGQAASAAQVALEASDNASTYSDNQCHGPSRRSSWTLVNGQTLSLELEYFDCCDSPSDDMDPVSTVANILAIINAANKLVGLCRRFLQVVKDAPGDLRLILVEVSTLRAVLDDLYFLVSCNHNTPALEALGRSHGPIEGIRKVVSELEKLLPPETILATDSKRKAVMTALGWLMKESRAKLLLDELREYKTTISLALIADSSRTLQETKTNTERIFARLDDRQEKEVYAWLHATDPSELHEKWCETYEPGTGEWLFRSPEWTSWLEERTRCLWVHGIPGAGKTIFASHLIETVSLRCKHHGPRFACVYYYCYFGHSQDETIPFLRWLLLELCRQLDCIPPVVLDLHRYGGVPTARKLLAAIEQVVQVFDKVFVFLDAVDESQERENLLRVLKSLATEARFENVRLLATSREYMDIEEVMINISIPVSMRNGLLDQDIALYIRSKLDSHPKLRRWSVDFREQVFQALTAKANGMFRWVVCQLDIIQRLKPEARILDTALANLPKDLDETYERVFASIDEDARLFVIHVLRWMSTHLTVHQGLPEMQPTATVNLCPVEVQRGTDMPIDLLSQGVQESLAEEEDCDPLFLDGYLLDEDFLRENCGCLIKLTRDTIRDHSAVGETSVVSFAHYTVLEFLESARIRRGLSAPYALDRKKVLRDHTKIVVSKAVETAGRWTDDWPEKRGPAFYSDFTRYCTHSAVLLMHWHGNALRSIGTSDWLASVVEFVQLPAPRSFGSYYWFSRHLLVSLENPLTPAVCSVLQSYHLRVLSPPPPGAPHLQTLARMLQLDQTGHLARSFLESLGRPASDLALPVDLEFQPYGAYRDIVTGSYDEEQQCFNSRYETLRFRGSLLEFLAHLPTPSWTHKGRHEFFKFAAGHFDPSTILLFATANHQHVDNGPGTQCWGCLTLLHLLQLGAKTTVPGYSVGALQIAVSLSDGAAVNLFLDSGVDANDMGDPDGAIGTPGRGPMFGCLQSLLQGRSPLNIVKQQKFVLLQSVNLWHREHQQIESGPLAALLIQHGAKDFVVRGSVADLDPESDMGTVTVTDTEEVNGALAAEMGFVSILEDGRDLDQSKVGVAQSIVTVSSAA